MLFRSWKEDLLLEESRSAAQLLAEALDGRGDGEVTIDVLEGTSASLRNTERDAEELRLCRLKYQILAAEPRLHGHEMVDFSEHLRPALVAGYSCDLRSAGVADAESFAGILAGLTNGALIEEMNVYRASVLRGTVDADLPNLAVLRAAIFANLRDAFRTFSAPGGGSGTS